MSQHASSPGAKPDRRSAGPTGAAPGTGAVGQPAHRHHQSNPRLPVGARDCGAPGTTVPARRANVLNRASFDAHGERLLQWAHSNQCGYAIALVDLDGFKAVNDTYGHVAGDELLKEVAARIKAALGGRHFPTRTGGDEFAIVFDPDTELDDAGSLANQIVSSLKRPFKIAGSMKQISGSVGIARLEGPGDTFASIVERADKALYQAKNAGRNQVQVLVMPDLSPSIVPAAMSNSADVTLFDELGVPAQTRLSFAAE